MHQCGFKRCLSDSEKSIPNQMGWRVGVTSGCSKYGISHIEQQRKVIYINNLIIFIVFIIFHNVGTKYQYKRLDNNNFTGYTKRLGHSGMSLQRSMAGRTCRGLVMAGRNDPLSIRRSFSKTGMRHGSGTVMHLTGMQFTRFSI